MLVILLVVVIDLIGFGIIIPFLPFYAESFGASPQRVTMLMAIFSIAQFIAAPFWGAMSDKFGRKVIICITLMGSVIAYIFLSLASSLLTLFIARALAGFMAGNISTAQAYIADISTKENRTKAMGLFGAAFGIGFILGPAIGGILAGPDPENPNTLYPPMFAALLSFIALTLSLLFLKNSNNILTNKNKRLENLLESLKVPSLGQLILLSFTVTVVFAMMESTFSLWSERTFEWGAQQNGYIFAYTGLCGALTQGILVGPLSKYFGDKILCRLGVFFLGIGMFGVSMTYSVIHVYIALTFIAVGLGLFMPTISSLIVNLVAEDRRGWVLGVNQSVSSISRIFGPLIAGILFEAYGKNMPYFFGAFILLLTMIFYKKIFIK
ncbi:MAG: hypothetical protein CMJ14_03635 [Pelagibacterales bacterium]|nr:hypothetical protein [Pelagibacterales bacterium]